jgi:regulatory protein
MTEKQSKPKKPRKKITRDYLRNAGAYYLQRFAASEANFRRVMERKIMKSIHEHPDQDRAGCISLLDEVVSEFCRLGYLNDATYALGLMRSLRQKGWSATRIMNRMRQSGLSDDDIEAASEDPENKIDDLSQAHNYARKKKLGIYRTPVNPDFYKKDLAALARAGFSYNVAQQVLQIPEEDAL